MRPSYCLSSSASRRAVSGSFSVSMNPAVSIPIGSTPMPTGRPSDLDRVGDGVEAEDAQARRAEVPRVVAHLEAHVVRSEQPAQHLLARREQTVDLGRGEGRVQEEADDEVGRAPAQHRRHEHEVEVVDPHARARARVLEDRVREALVDVDVALPRLRRQPEPVAEVVQERPQRVVADAVVEVVDPRPRRGRWARGCPRQDARSPPPEATRARPSPASRSRPSRLARPAARRRARPPTGARRASLLARASAAPAGGCSRSRACDVRGFGPASPPLERRSVATA